MRRSTSTKELMYRLHMSAVLTAALLFFAAGSSERPARLVEGEQAPARITRATVLTPADGPPVVLYAATNLTDRQIDTITVMAFVFKPDGTLKARQTAPGRRTLEPRETKYSTLVLDGSNVEPSDVVVIGINQAQNTGSDAWWRTDLQRAAEAAVPLKKP
jgi:hypothetical protein